MTEQYQKSRASTEREFTRFGERVLLGDGIRNGIDPPEVLEPDVLLRGKVHIIYSGPGNGKTMLALWLAKRCMQRRARVVLFDTENGVRTVSERLADLGVNPNRVDKYLWYYPDPTLPVSDSAKQAYEAFLDRVEPTLVIFDSLISFLAGAGLSENENTDIARWATVYAHPARGGRLNRFTPLKE
jgi:hypothetical protein